MSGSASLDLERQLLGHTLAIAPMPTLSRVYVALCLTAPTETAGGTEASGGGYSRMPATFALMSSPSNAASNAAAVEFLAATSAWGTIGYFELWTQATGGTRLYWGPLTDPADGVPIEMDVTTGDVVRFSAGALIVQAADAAMTGGVSSFNARTGAVTLASDDVMAALTYAPYNSTNPAGYQTAANVTTTVQAALRYTNSADNSGFSVNQRAYVSGAALGAGIYAHDRWKAGAGGCTYTYTQSGGPATTITITAGTLQQVVEGLSVAGGSYMLSWTGTAQGRVGAGSYAASPVAVTGIVAGANTTIEFNAGTVSQVNLEAGTVVTPWLARDAASELGNCQRFYVAGSWVVAGYNSAGATTNMVMHALPVVPRAVPAIAISGAPTLTNCSAPSLSMWQTWQFLASVTTTALGSYQAYGNFTASADL
jgi:hypothetical protein